MKTKLIIFLFFILAIAAACSAIVHRATLERMSHSRMWFHKEAGVKLFPRSATMKMYTHNYLLPSYRASFNNEGFRDGNFSREKPPDTVRIIVLGDSFAFGWGVEQDETFDSQLENMLRKKHAGLNVEAINMAIPGLNHVSELGILRAIGVGYHPDIVIVHVTLDDIFPDSNSYRAGGTPPMPGEFKRYGDSREGNREKEKWMKHMFKMKTVEEMKKNGFDTLFDTFAAAPIGEMNALAAKHGFKLVLVCHVGPPLKNYYDVLSKKLGIENIWLKDAYKFKWRVLPANARMMIRGDGHPTAAAHRLFAYHVAEHLEMPGSRLKKSRQ